jgi:AhpD family alkylhydroperoxidase
VLKTRRRKSMMQRVNASAVAPAGIAALRAVEQYVESSGLDPNLIVLVKIRVSQINGCAYCLHMHTQHARKLGESDMRIHLLDAWRESHLYSTWERAALAWAESLTKIATSHAPDDVYREARRHFSEKQLTDLSIGIGMINAWNRLCIGTRAEHPSDLANAA